MKHLLNLLLFCAIAMSSRSQTAKAIVFSSYYDLMDSLTVVKTTVEDFGKEMKHEWKNDSLKLLAQSKYTKVRATMAGIIESFSAVIMNPKSMKKQKDAEKIRLKITAQLKKLYEDMNSLSSFYVNAKEYLIKGGKFGTTSVITNLFEAGVKVFEMIKAMIKKDRKEKANEFSKKCSIEPWSTLKKTE